MPTLEWIGKDKVVNHDKEVPFRLLKEVRGKSLNGDDTENMIIHGDNLEALKALLPHYAGKVKMIYIDPPYNTGEENWIYNDKVNSPQMKEWLGKIVGKESEDLCRHDKWLCMLYPRLKLLRELLDREGVICISIDDNENYHLRRILDDIFGVNNFLASIIWDLGTGTRAGHFTRAHEYIIVYAKDKSLLTNFVYEGEEDIISERAIKKISKANPASIIEFPAGIDFEGEDSEFVGVFGGSEKVEVISGKMTFKNGKLEEPVKLMAGWAMRNQILSWLSGEETYDSKGQRVKRFYFAKNGKLQYEKIRGFVNPPSVLRKLASTKEGTKEIENIFGKGVFQFPKPSKLIRELIKIVSCKGDIILDSFAGSGTTAHAVLNLNKEDGGNRKFILVEMEDYADTITAERVRRVIKGYGKGKNKVEGTSGGFKYMELSEDPLFDRHGVISPKATYDDLANYIFFTETHNSIDRKKDKPKEGYLGEKGGVHYFLIFDGFPDLVFKNYLTEEFLQTLDKFDGKKVVYADAVLLDDETLRERGIEFKQIPYEIKTF